MRLRDLFSPKKDSDPNRDTLKDFLDDKSKTETFIEYLGYRIFIRKTKRSYLALLRPDYHRTGKPKWIPEPQGVPTIDIAKIDRIDPNVGGKFKQVMHNVEWFGEQRGFKTIYVEQIFSKFLPAVLKRYGYEEELSLYGGGIPSYVKVIGDIK